MKKLFVTIMAIMIVMTGCTSNNLQDSSNSMLTVENPIVIPNENIVQQGVVNPGENLVKIDVTLLNNTTDIIQYELSQFTVYDTEDKKMNINEKYFQKDIPNFESGTLQPGQRTSGAMYISFTDNQKVGKIVMNDKDQKELAVAKVNEY